MDVNYWGVVHTCRSFAPRLRALSSDGRRTAIVNVLSDFALFSLPTKAAYAASKYAARAFTESLTAELYGTGVSVTAAFVGATATRLVSRGIAVDRAAQAREAAFLERGMAPERVAQRILRAARLGRARVTIGSDAWALELTTRFSPRLLQFAVRRGWRHIPMLSSPEKRP